MLMLYGTEIGSYTQSQIRPYYKGATRHDMSDLRPFDLIYYLSAKKAADGRTVSHVSIYLGGIYGERILHTTGKTAADVAGTSRPDAYYLRTDPLTYWASGIARAQGKLGGKNVLRVLSAAQLDALTIKKVTPPTPPTPPTNDIGNELVKISAAVEAIRELI